MVAIWLSCLNAVSGSRLSHSQPEHQRQVVKIIIGKLSTMRVHKAYKQNSTSVGKRPLQIAKQASDVVPTVKITMLSPSQGLPGYLSAAEAYWKKGITCYYLDESSIGVLANFPP